MPATIQQERPSIAAIVANRGLDAVVVFIGISVVALPFFAMVKEIGMAFVLLAIVGAFLIFGRMLVDLLERGYSMYTLEADRLTVDRGIISHQRIVVPLESTVIQRVAAQQPFLGRIVGYGHVLIFTSGWGIVRLRYVSNPYAWQEDILKRLGTIAGSPITSPRVQQSGALPSTQVGSSGLRRLLLAASGLVIIVCVCTLVFSAGSVTMNKPLPSPTPARGVIVFPSITGADMLGSLWWLYQIPLIFWSVNAIILANIVVFLINIVGRRQR